MEKLEKLERISRIERLSRIKINNVVTEIDEDEIGFYVTFFDKDLKWIITLDIDDKEDLELMFKFNLIKRVEINGFIDYVTIDNNPIF